MTEPTDRPKVGDGGAVDHGLDSGDCDPRDSDHGNGAGSGDLLSREVLVLNRLWQAINVVPVRRAIGMLYSGKAKAIDEEFSTFTWEGWVAASVEAGPGTGNGRPAAAAGNGGILHTVSDAVRVPKVVQHLHYDRIPRPRVKFTRTNIYLRDRYRCQYCGCDSETRRLNIDHVVPRSRGGRSTWDNVVVACIECNLRKGDRLPEEAGMQVRRPPRRPRWHPAALLSLDGEPPPLWRPFLGGYA